MTYNDVYNAYDAYVRTYNYYIWPKTISHKTMKSKDHLLKQTGICAYYYGIINSHMYMLLIIATQMWCLARLLPMFIGMKIKKGDEHWENFLRMLDYCFAPTIRKDWAAYLRMLINS